MENNCEHGTWEELEMEVDDRPFPEFIDNPKPYLDPQRRCVYCGKIQTLTTVQKEIKEWR